MPASAMIRRALTILVAGAGLGEVAAGLAHVAFPAVGAGAGLGGWPVALGLLAALGLCAHAILGGVEETR